MSATKAVAELLRADLEWRRFFKLSCEGGALRLWAAGRQFRDELASRGHEANTQQVRAALVQLAAKTLPDTPAGRAAKGEADWMDHLLDCECLDCAATLPRYAIPVETTSSVAIPEEGEQTEAREDAKLAAAGIIQSERQVFDLAREHFDGAAGEERGGAA